MKKETKVTIQQFSNRKTRLILEGVTVGVFGGLAVSLFRMVLHYGESFREKIVENFKILSMESMLIYFLLFILAYIIVSITFKKVPLCTGSGIPQVKGELIGQIDQPWWQILLGKFIGGFFALSAGLSLGREGPSVQLGAVVGKGLAKVSHQIGTEEKMMITCGAAAGLSGAFCAPLAGTVFALEELHKNFSTSVLIATMSASIASDFVSANIFGLTPVFQLPATMKLPIHLYWQVLVLGIILGAFGVLYNKITDIMQGFYGKIENTYIKTAIPFLLTLPMFFFFPYVLGGGSALVGNVAIELFSLKFLFLLFIIKFLYSIVCSTSGIPGGIFLPLLVLGALIGGLYGESLVVFGYDNIFAVNFVILGMTGLFTSIVHSPVTGVILITEMTGAFTNFMPLTIVALVSFITASLLEGKPIYDQMLGRLLQKKTSPKDEKNNITKRKILVESPVCIGSKMDGGLISNMKLPPGCLIVAVERNEREFVPNGKTVLKGGDKLVLICAESYLAELEEQLENICKEIYN